MTCEPSAIEIHTHLLELQAERALASIEGLAVGSVYRADLDVVAGAGRLSVDATLGLFSLPRQTISHDASV